MLEQEEQSTATALRATTCSTNTVDVVIGVIRRVILDDPVDLREIKTSLCNICAKKNACLSLAEFEIC